MSKKSLLFKSIATVVTTVAVTMSVATGTTIGRVMERNENTSELPADGNKGKEGRGISAVEKTNTYGLIDEYTITYTDNTTSTFIVVNGADGEQGIQGFPGKDGETPTIEIGENGTWVINGTDTGVAVQGAKGDQGEQGEKGEDGRSIESVVKTETNGLVDTYTITYSDGSTSEFLVVNGANGEQGIQGLPGQDGRTPTIEVGANGNWVVDGEDTGVAARGEQGEAGTSVYTGAGNPNDNNIAGKQGDAYIDSETWDYYVFNGETWEHQGNIQGGQGQQGQTGEQGPQGEQGSSVLIGVDDPSDDPLSPSNAREGDAYINTTTGNIFKLVEGHWEIFGNLQGAQGVPGEQGQTGEQGQAGEDGRSVESIEKTETNGLVDTYTITYSEGEPSTFTVTNGADGQNGATLLFGATDPEEEQGVEGDSYVNVSSWEYWVKENGAWVNKGSFRGDDGVSIVDITKSGSEGRVDTYTITYSDSTNENPHTTSFTVTNGNTLITGTTDPSNIGNDGDSYLNTQTWEYFVKEDGAWVSQGHISGTSFRTGHGNPNDNSVSGINGDSYLDLDEWKFYSYNANESKWDFDANLFEKYVITFNTNGGSEAPEAQTVREGRKAVKPVVDPTKENYFFQGWYTAEGNKWDFEKDVVSGSLTLYAHWAQFEVTNGVLTGCSATGDVIVPSYFNDQMVTEIGEGLFENNETVTSVTLPNTVTSIADNAFKGSKVEEVYLPESLLTIGNNAFSGCTKLTSIVIPNSVRSIGANAFDGATALKYVVINDTSLRRLNALNIGNEAFKDCAQLVAVTMPNRVNSIGANAFAGCASLESLTVPFVGGSKEENQTLGYLFDNAVPASLKTVILTGDTAIGENAFANAASIENLIFEGVPESFAKNALSDLTSLKKLEVPYVAGDYLGYVFGAETYNENNANVPVSLKEVTVTGEEAIVENAFYGLVNLTNIEIENSVSVGDSAFEGCEALESLKLNTTYSTNFYKLFGAQDENETETKVPHSLKNVELMNATNVPDAYFHNIRYVENVTLNEGITSIGDNAFALCVNLRNVNLPNTVTSIGENGFANCSLLENVDLPSGLTSLGEKAFYNCERITNVVLPRGLNNLPNSVFEGCNSLKSIVIPENIKTIGDRAFAGCYALAAVAFNGELTSLGSEAFESCYALSVINLPNVTDSLGNGVLKNCAGLKVVVLPTSLTVIPESMFEGCNSLQNLNLDQLTGLQEIGVHAFKDCTSIVTLVVPNTVETMGKGFLTGCTSLASLTVPFIGNVNSDTANRYFAYFFDGELATRTKVNNGTYNEANTNVPYSLKAVRITNATEISAYCFSWCASIKYFLLDCDIETIGAYAFAYCNSIENIIFPDTLETIGGRGFYSCENLSCIELPDEVWDISTSCFEHCISLESVYGDYVDSIYSRAFGYCISLHTFGFLSLTTIQDNAFYECSSLVNVDFTNGLTYIGSNAFSRCYSLVSINIPDTVTNIGYRAFEYCISLKALEIKNPNCYVNSGVLDGCNSLTKLTLPFVSSIPLSSIMSSSFNKIPGLKEISVTEGVEAIGDYAFQNIETIEVINLPSSLKEIGYMSFAYTKNIKSIVIPEGVETIKDYAFYGSEYVYIVLPSTLKTIKQYAFANNPIKNLIIPSGVESIGTAILVTCNEIETLEIPFLGSSASSEDARQFIGYEWGQLSYTGSQQIARSLKTLTIGGANPTLAKYAFYYCYYLENIILKEGFTTIKTDAFYNCGRIKNVSFPSTLTTIETRAFDYLYDLESIDLPAGCTNIEYAAFWSCAQLKEISLSLDFLTDNYVYNLVSDSVDPTNDDGNDGETWLNIETGYYFYKADGKWTCIGNVNRVYGDDGTYTLDVNTNDVVLSETAPAKNNSYAWVVPSTGEVYWTQNVSGILYWTHMFDITYNAFSCIFGGSYCVTPQLETVTVKDIAYVPAHLFEKIQYVKTINLPDNITSIGDGAFQDCSSLETVNIPDTVTSFGEAAFSGCSSLKAINIPSLVTRIEQNTFNNCASLAEINIHSGITYLGSYAFAHCDSLTEIVVPSTVTTISNGAFQSCAKLESITLPYVGSSSEIGSDSYLAYVFGGSKYDTIMKEYIGSSYSGIPTSLKAVVLTGLNGENKDELPEKTFAGLSNLEYVVLPSNTAKIGAYAFQGCTGLTSFTVSNKVTSIGQGAFKDCNGLESIVLPFIGSGSDNADEQYFAWIFDGAKFTISALNTYQSLDTKVPTSLKTVVLSNNTNMNKVYDGAFAYCSDIKTLVLRNNYTTVGEYSFIGCSSLEDFDLPASVNAIGEGAFMSCNGWVGVNYYEGHGVPKTQSAVEEGTWYIDVDTGDIYTLEQGVWYKGKYFWDNHKLVSGWQPSSSYGEDGDYIYWNWGIYHKYDGSWHEGANVFPHDGSDFHATDTSRFYIDTYTNNIYIYDAIAGTYHEGGFEYLMTGSGEPIPPTNYTELLTVHGRFYVDLDGTGTFACGQTIYLYHLENYDWTPIDLPIRIGHGSNPNEAIRVDREGDHYLDLNTNVLYAFENGEWVEEKHAVTTGSTSPLAVTVNSNIGDYYKDSNSKLYVKNSNGLETFTVPNGVTVVSSNMFANCDGLKNVILPGTVTEIASGAFVGCSSLERVTALGHITTIGANAFYGDKRLEGFDFSYVTDIETYAFYQTGVHHAYFTNGDVANIGSFAFSECGNLTSVVMTTAHDLNLGAHAFDKCYSLTSVVLPNSGVASIGDSAFENCYSLTSFMVPSSVTSIGQAAFKNCRNLTTLALHNALASIGENAFQNCYSLTRVIAYDFADAAAYETFVNDTNKVATGNDALKPGGVLTVTVASFQA